MRGETPLLIYIIHVVCGGVCFVFKSTSHVLAQQASSIMGISQFGLCCEVPNFLFKILKCLEPVSWLQDVHTHTLSKVLASPWHGLQKTLFAWSLSQ